jgi:hopanoid biosynthesis associated protein HpnK
VTRTLILTADDFGLDIAVNEAVERAHTQGILTCASLMVGASATADAIDRARRLPQLGVGLHLTLVDGAPTLPRESVRMLIGDDGRFPADPYRQGVRILCSPAAHSQAAAEIRAQLDAFRATGLTLDHVNAHHHFHLHPIVQRVLVRLAPEYGIRAVRVPLEVRKIGAGPLLEQWMTAVYARRLGRRLKQAGIAANDAIFGLSDSGRMYLECIHAALSTLTDGVNEIYLHPVSRPWQRADPWPATYDGLGELQALLDPALRAAVTRRPIRLATFATAWVP